MLLNHRNLAVIHAACKDEFRPTLHTIRFEADGSTVATNGHILAIVKPEVPLEGKGQIDPFQIDIDKLKDINKEQRKGFRAKRTELHVGVTNTKANHASVYHEPLGLIEIEKDTSEYPNYEQVRQTDPVHHTVGLGIEVLEQVCAVARQFTNTKKGGSGGLILKFEFTEDPNSPVTVTKVIDGDTLEITVMPGRLT